MSSRDDEINQFEEIVLDWFRTATIFFIAGIALYHFTNFGKPYTVIAFMLTIVLMITMIVDYLDRRSTLVAKGHSIRMSLDVLIATMMVALALVLWITREVIIEPYKDNPAIDYFGIDEVLDSD